MLSGQAIQEEIKRDAIYVDNSIKSLGENYIVVTLGDKLKVYEKNLLSVTKATPTKELKIKKEGTLLKPRELYIGRTLEFTKTYGFVPILAGLDELAAIGMEIHVTAGFGDNGFEGTWTLEIVCANPTIVYPNMPIGRLYYNPIIGKGEQLYQGKYFQQIDATASKLSDEYSNSGKVKTYVNK